MSDKCAHDWTAIGQGPTLSTYIGRCSKCGTKRTLRYPATDNKRCTCEITAEEAEAASTPFHRNGCPSVQNLEETMDELLSKTIEAQGNKERQAPNTMDQESDPKVCECKKLKEGQWYIIDFSPTRYCSRCHNPLPGQEPK